MPYNFKIRDEEGVYMRGTARFFNDNDEEMGQAVIYPGGTDVDPEFFDVSTYVNIEVPGYYGSTWPTFNLVERNEFIVIKKPNLALIAAAGLAAGYLLFKHLKF